MCGGKHEIRKEEETNERILSFRQPASVMCGIIHVLSRHTNEHNHLQADVSLWARAKSQQVSPISSKA